MKILIALGILAALAVFVGCNGTVTPPTGNNTSQGNNQTPNNGDVVKVSGEDVFNSTCSRCHPAGDARVEEFTASGHGTWIMALDRMKASYGVTLTTEEYNAVKNYLINTYGVPIGT